MGVTREWNPGQREQDPNPKNPGEEEKGTAENRELPFSRVPGKADASRAYSIVRDTKLRAEAPAGQTGGQPHGKAAHPCPLPAHSLES